MKYTRPGWAVAAAIMIIENRPMHYSDITKRAVETKLSGLKSRGGQTEWQTLAVELRKNRFIRSPRRGYYQVEDIAIGNEDVRSCISLLMNDAFKRHEALARTMVQRHTPLVEELAEFNQLHSDIGRIVNLLQPYVVAKPAALK